MNAAAASDPEWSEHVEALLAIWADIAACYSWMHDRSFRRYRIWHYVLSIPVIVLSTVTGTANFAMSSVPPENRPNVQIAIGTASIAAGVISTLQSFFRYAQTGEAHHAAHRDWTKFHRTLQAELVLEPEARRPVVDVLRESRVELNRLTETSPVIPLAVVRECTSRFGSAHAGLHMPEICNQIRHTVGYREATMVQVSTPPPAPGL